jgi:hypothetical protein
MTIVASVKVRDGVILGTDSMTQISQNTPQGPQILKAYSNARKLFQITARPIGVATYGLGNLGQRSIEGVVLDFCRGPGAQAASVQGVTQELYDFVRPLYDAEFQGVADDQRPTLGFYVAGYTDGQPFPEEWEFLLPRDPGPILARATEDFGSSWRGIDIGFTRLYKGVDPRLFDRLVAAGLTAQQVTQAFDGLETPVIYDGMPVQDAIDFCGYILETTIGWTAVQLGAASCGYPLQVAMILADDGFDWVARPDLAVRRPGL